MTKQNDLVRAKKLIAKYRAQLSGQRIYENFGQDFVRMLEDEFSDYRYGDNQIWPLISQFDEWCANYTGGQK